MKKIFSVFLMSVSVFSFLACTSSKEEIPIPSLTFYERVEVDFESLRLFCSVSGNVTAESLSMDYSKDASLSQASTVKFQITDNRFTANVSGLESKTTYYYRYTVVNRFGSYQDQNVRSFSTAEYEEPVFSVLSISDVLPASASVSATLSKEGSLPIIERGFCYATTANPSDSDEKVMVPSSENTYSVVLSSLNPSTKYYVRAYAKNSMGTYYSAQQEFTTASGSITFGELGISDILPQSAKATVTIEDTGGSTVTERGFCYSTTANPTISDVKVTVSSSENTYSAALSSLSPSTKYCIRAYAKNSWGTYYSAQQEFTTTVGSITFGDPVISDILPQSAKATVTIEDTGGSTVTERGFCYSTTANPTVSDVKVTVSSSENTYSATLSSLSPSTKYCIRAYAVNSSGTFYSSQKEFITGEEKYVAFEDQEFEEYCLQNFDKNGDGKISYSEAESVSVIDVCTDNIFSLKGIEAFINLSSLKARGSGGMYKRGSSSTSSGNTEGLTSPDDGTSCAKGKLSEIDLSELLQLKDVDVSCNNRITRLILPISCEKVDAIICNLNELNVQSLFFLKWVYISGNQLSSLDVSKNTQLVSLTCSNNQLSTLDVSKNTLLTSLWCSSNQLSTLDVNKNTLLTLLWCDSNQLSSLDVSKNIQLERLSCGGNQLSSLDVSYNIELAEFSCDGNQLSSLDVSKNIQLERLSCGGNQLATLDMGKNSRLAFLSCSNNQLSKLDMSKNMQLTILWCMSNMLSTLNISTNVQLTQLLCSYNQLSSLDVSNNTLLASLYCNNNQLSSLDVSKNAQLTDLQCRSNPNLATIWLSYGQAIKNFSYDSFTTIQYK